MELRTAFLPQLEVRQPQLTGFFPRRLTMKRELETPVVVAVSNSNRDTFPTSHCGWKHLEVHSNDHQRVRHLPLPKVESPKGPELSFIRLQPTDQETAGLYMRKFGRFVAREALLDEEIWTAAYLRAEAHWESVSYMRHVDNYKIKYAEQEFYALKRRCSGQDGNSLKCFCFVAVKKEEKNVRRTVINSVVGTLDLSVRQFVQGETYPGEVNRVSPVLVRHDPFDRHKYAYISNVCVAKYARRQGIASNLLYLATEVATTTGLKQLFVHVNADNKPAQELYEKTGFKIVEASASTLSKDQRLLMSIDL
ncbi:OLC1v1005183C1 [Oldenlandia corymbosa var. corymbosa]|uniref:OLC1v1005183C1 n=1 Tax=Oldenlandia corymbosa var. corymbosa TaxID=529605 RepID=A0AAV1DE94_OLDCO|nr:OLC1v1005183C1 [Oldenlandia corymbosa var. corymbosa]